MRLVLVPVIGCLASRPLRLIARDLEGDENDRRQDQQLAGEAFGSLT
jgi:hypothetical protein